MGSAALAAWRKERENTVVRHLAGPYQPLPPSPPPDRAAPNDLDAHQGARASAMTLWPQPNDFEHSQPSLSSSESPMWEEVVQCGRLCPMHTTANATTVALCAISQPSYLSTNPADLAP